MEALTQHFAFQLFVYLGVCWFALIIEQIFPGHTFCVSSVGLALQSAGIQDGHLRSLGNWGGLLAASW